MKFYLKLAKCFLILLLAIGLISNEGNVRTFSTDNPKTESDIFAEHTTPRNVASPKSISVVKSDHTVRNVVSYEETECSKGTEFSERTEFSEEAEFSEEDGFSEESEFSEESKCGYVFTQIVVNTDSLAEEDKEHVTYQMDSFYVLDYENKEDAKAALDRYDVQKDTKASYVKRMHTMDSGMDDYAYLSWGPEAIHSKEFRNKIIDKYGSDDLPEIIVGIIDSGVDYNHEFLKGRMNSYQYDFVDNDGDAMDENSHGTHVAGIIADMTLPNVKLNAYRVLDAQGHGTDAAIAAGIEQAVKDGVDVINMSLGGAGTSDIVYAALDKAIAADIVVVVAAGNECADAGNVCPANYGKALTVAALEQGTDGQAPITASYSNYGAVIDVCAPGSDIYSSVLNQQYELQSGTSMATPFVAASAALLRTYDGEASYKTISDTLKMNADDLGDIGFDIHYGYGEINLASIDAYSSLVEEPVFNKAPGEYDNPIEVTLSSPDEDAVIYYTTDGTIPTGSTEHTTEQIYSQPIAVDKSSMIVAVAKREGQPVGAIAAARYYIGGMGMEDDFEMRGDQSGYIYKYTGSQTKLVIPETIQGQTVVGIGGAAFQANSTILDLTIPDTVVSIEDFAFNNTLLERVYFGKKVKEFGDLCFTSGFNAFTIRELVVDEENPYLVVKDDVLYTADMEELLLYISYKTDAVFRIPDTVKTVRYGAIQDLRYLKTLEVPAGVEELSYHTRSNDYGIFLNANYLSVNVDDDNQSYSSDHGILYNKEKTVLYHYPYAQTASNYTMPDSVRRVSMYCFSNDNLQSITLSKNLQVIESSAFTNLENVKTFIIPAAVTKLNRNAFMSRGVEPLSIYFDGDLPADAKEIVWLVDPEKVKIYRYPEAEGFESLPESDYEINDRTDGEYHTKYTAYTVAAGGTLFFHASDRTIAGYKGVLGDLDIPSSIDGVPVEKISEKAFDNCETITSVVIPPSVTDIGEGAFQDCPALLSVKVAGSVQTISKRAFYNDRMLREIVLEEGVQKVCREGFGRKWFGDVPTEEMTISIPSSLAEIGDYAFYGCNNLQSLNVPEGVAKIGKYAFGAGERLESLTLPKGLKSIGDYAFSGNPFLWTLNIPRGVNYIGDGAFFCYGTGGQSVTIRGNAGKIGENAFYNHSTVYYEEGARNFDQPTLSKYTLQMIERIPYPELRVATNDKILLEHYDGYEYSKDGGASWQAGALFTDLEENTSYEFCIRKAGSAGGMTGENSETAIYKTSSGIYRITAKYGTTLGQCLAKLPESFIFMDNPSTEVGEIGDRYFDILYDMEKDVIDGQLTQTVCIHVEKAEPYVASNPVANDITLNQTLGESVISGGSVWRGKENANLLEGSWSWDNAAIKPELEDSEILKYKAVFQPEDSEHYTTATALITIKVNKITQPDNAPDSEIYVGCPNRIVGQIPLPEGWQWQEADCDKELPEEIPVQVTAIYNASDASCYEILEIPVTITRTSTLSEHSFSDWTLTKEATCTEQGEKERFCNICGYKETMSIPATGNGNPTEEQKPDNTQDTGIQKLTKKQLEANSNQLNIKSSSSWKNNSLYIKWGKVKGAKGYDIFVAAYNKKYKKITKTVKANKTSVKITKINNKKLNKGTAYKACVKAYRMVNGKKQYIATGFQMYTVGSKHAKHTNARSLKVSKKSYTLKKGKTATIKASIVKQDKKKKLLPKSYGKPLRYISINKQIATVSSNGKITAKGKGTCYVYVFALNGVSKKIKVTVR